MIRVAICDDSDYVRRAIKECLERYSFQRNVDFVIDEYESGESMLKAEEEGICHNLVIMDYEFEDKGQDGISIIRELRKQNRYTKVIFLSSHSMIAHKCFEVDTFRFLEKPFDDGSIYKAMDDYFQSLNPNVVLSVRVTGETYLFSAEEILYVEGYGKRSIIHLTNNRPEIICNETLAAIESRLSGLVFFRSHRSFVVNMMHVRSYSKLDITMKNDEKVLMSRSNYKRFSMAMIGHIMHKEGMK